MVTTDPPDGSADRTASAPERPPEVSGAPVAPDEAEILQEQVRIALDEDETQSSLSEIALDEGDLKQELNAAEPRIWAEAAEALHDYRQRRAAAEQYREAARTGRVRADRQRFAIAA